MKSPQFCGIHWTEISNLIQHVTVGPPAFITEIVRRYNSVEIVERHFQDEKKFKLVCLESCCKFHILTQFNHSALKPIGKLFDVLSIFMKKENLTFAIYFMHANKHFKS